MLATRLADSYSAQRYFRYVPVADIGQQQIITYYVESRCCASHIGLNLAKAQRPRESATCS